MVTILRNSCGGGAATSGEPQARQNFAMSGFSVPHWPQNGMRRSVTESRAIQGFRTGSRNVYGPSTQSPQKGDVRYVVMDE